MKKYYTLTLTKGTESLTDIKIDRKGFNLTKSVGAMGRHVVQSCKVKVRGKNVIDFILAADDYISAKVYNGESCIFEGVIKPYIQIAASQVSTDSILLNILDYTELLDKHVFNDLTKFGGTNPEGAVISRKWKNCTARQILADLFTLAGIDSLCTVVYEQASGLDVSFIDFRICEGDIIHKCIDELCYELLLDYRFDVGKCIVFPTDEFHSAENITDYRLTATINRNDDTDDGIKLSYQTFTTQKTQIYKENNRFDQSVWDKFQIHLATWETKKGYYYKMQMHGEEGALPPTDYTCYWSFKDLTDEYGDVTVIDVADAEITPVLHDEEGVTIEAHLDSYDETGGCAYISYDGEFNNLFGTGWGFEYTVTANVSFKKTYEVSVSAGLKPKSVRLKYVDTLANAARFGDVYLNRQKSACVAFSFISNQVLEPGKCYLFKEDKTIGISANVRILSASYDEETKLYSYKAEGANKTKTLPLVPQPTVSGGDSSQNLPAEKVDFFYLVTDRTMYLKEEKAEIATVSAKGFALDTATSIDWILDGSNLNNHTRQASIAVRDMHMGANVLVCRIVIDTKPYERSVSILKTQSSDNAIMQYRYGADPIAPPYTEGGVWFWNQKAIFLGGVVLGNVNSEDWTAGIPEKTAEAPYLWMRVSSDGGANWTYTRLHASDDVSFRIVADKTSYPWSVRGATVQTTVINLKVEKTNTVAPVSWYSTVFEGTKTGDSLRLSIPAGLTDKIVKVSAVISGVGREELTITAYEIGSVMPTFVGEYKSVAELESLPQNPLGFPWAEGDHAIVVNIKTAEGEADKYDPMPYVYHKTSPHWRMLDVNDDNYGTVWGNTVADILKYPNLDLTCKAQYGIFENLAAVKAFIDKLFANFIVVQKAIYGGGYEESGRATGGDGFYLSNTGKLKAVNAELSGTFSCSVMETVLDQYDKGCVQRNYPAGSGTRIIGDYHPVQDWARSIMTGRHSNENVYISWTDGYYSYRDIYFQPRLDPNAAFDGRLSLEVIPDDVGAGARLAFIEPSKGFGSGMQAMIRPFDMGLRPRYSESISTIHYGYGSGSLNYSHTFDFSRYYDISDLTDFPDLGHLPVEYRGSITVNGVAYTSNDSIRRKVLMTPGAITITDISGNVIASFGEFDSASMDFTYDTVLTGLKTKTLYPFDDTESYLGTPAKRYSGIYGSFLDCTRIYANTLPQSYDAANYGEVYVDGDYLRIKK